MGKKLKRNKKIILTLRNTMNINGGYWKKKLPAEHLKACLSLCSSPWTF